MNFKNFVDLVVSGSLNEQELEFLKYYKPLLITNKNNEIIEVGLKQPGLNYKVITSDGITSVSKLRNKYGLDDDNPSFSINLPANHYYIRNFVDEITRTTINKYERANEICLHYHGKGLKDLIQTMPKPSVYIDNDNSLDFDVAMKFVEVGNNQRGNAEHAMLKYQNLFGGGVYSAALEHIGDLIHRCTHMLHYGEVCQPEMTEKINKMLNLLESKYPFLQEHEENVLSNYHFKQSQEGYKGSLDEFRKELDEARFEYRKCHGELPSYNKLHLACKRSCIALSDYDIPVAILSLKQVKSALEDNYNTKAISYKQDNKGELLDITHTDSYLSKALNIKREISHETSPA